MGISSAESQQASRWKLGMQSSGVLPPFQHDEDKLQANILRMIRSNVALSSKHDVAHGTALLRVISGHVDSLLQRGNGDAMLQACAIADDIPRIRGLLNSLEQWAKIVSKLGPDDVPPEGANRCL